MRHGIRRGLDPVVFQHFFDNVSAGQQFTKAVISVGIGVGGVDQVAVFVVQLDHPAAEAGLLVAVLVVVALAVENDVVEFRAADLAVFDVAEIDGQHVCGHCGNVLGFTGGRGPAGGQELLDGIIAGRQVSEGVAAVAIGLLLLEELIVVVVQGD